MKKEDFFNKLEDLFEIDEKLDDDSHLDLESIDILGLVAFLDENFSVNKTAEELNNITTVKNIIEVIGKDKLE